MQPKVSIIIPTYQRAALLPRALKSVLAQTYENWELIVVDDGSTDHTSEIVRQYAERYTNLQYVFQSNQGASAARNRGIDVACGEFVAFLDSDDEYLPDMIERRLSLFQIAPALGLIFTDYSYVDLSGLIRQSALRDFFSIVYEVPRDELRPSSFVLPMGIKDWLGQSYFVSTITGMVRRDVLDNNIRFSCAQDYAEEWHFFSRVAERCRVGFIDEPLAVHHFTRGSITRTEKRNQLGRIKSLEAMLIGIERLTHIQRQKLRLQLSDALSDLGFSNARRGDETNATLCHWKAFLQVPILRNLRRTAQQAFKATVATLESGGLWRKAVGCD
jgi:glycosyltransferase involved in cell wall biosynthesis